VQCLLAATKNEQKKRASLSLLELGIIRLQKSVTQASRYAQRLPSQILCWKAIELPRGHTDDKTSITEQIEREKEDLRKIEHLNILQFINSRFDLEAGNLDLYVTFHSHSTLKDQINMMTYCGYSIAEKNVWRIVSDLLSALHVTESLSPDLECLRAEVGQSARDVIMHKTICPDNGESRKVEKYV
jgi:hypothetical protein